MPAARQLAPVALLPPRPGGWLRHLLVVPAVGCATTIGAAALSRTTGLRDLNSAESDLQLSELPLLRGAPVALSAELRAPPCGCPQHPTEPDFGAWALLPSSNGRPLDPVHRCAPVLRRSSAPSACSLLSERVAAHPHDPSGHQQVTLAQDTGRGRPRLASHDPSRPGWRRNGWVGEQREGGILS